MVTPTFSVNIIIVTPSDIIRRGLQSLFANTPYSCTSFNTIESIPFSSIHNVIVFLYDPHEDELTIKQQIIGLKNINRDIRVIVLSSRTNLRFIWNTLEQGANGFLCLHEQTAQRIMLFIQDNNPDVLCLSPTAQKALTMLRYYGDIQLTEYQREVINLMLQQKSASQIAKALHRNLDAVYQVQRRLRDFFSVSNNSDLVQKLTDLDFIQTT